MVTSQNQVGAISLLRRPTLEKVLGKGRSTIYKEIQEGLMTPPVNIGGGRVGWPDYEAQKINQARIAGADDEQIKALVAELTAKRKTLFA